MVARVFSKRRLLSRCRCNAVVCMLTHGSGPCVRYSILKGRTGCVRFATHLRTWRMSSISCLVAQLTVMSDQSRPVFFSRPFLSQIFSLTLNQTHVVVLSQSGVHVENLLFPPDISFSAILCDVLCLLAPCWSPGHQNIKLKKRNGSPVPLAANTGGVAVNRSATFARPTFPAKPGAEVAGAGGKGTAAASLAAWCSLAVSCTA